MKFKFDLDDNQFKKKLGKITGAHLQAAYRGVYRAGLQQLAWVINGPPGTKINKTPPIRTAFLRSAGQVLVNGRPAYTALDINIISEKGQAKKINSGTRKPNTYNFEIIFNAKYAAKMEKGGYNLGELSKQAGNAGPKFLESHMKGDKEMILDGIADYIKKKVPK